MSAPAASRFWGSTLAGALAFTLLVRLLLLLRRVPPDPAAERARAWLVTVFCAGVLLLLFGAWALLVGRLRGAREVLREQRAAAGGGPAAAPAAPGAGWRNAGVWAAAAGGWLILIYFVLWRVLR